MECPVGFVKDRPQVAERVVVPPVTDCSGTAGEVRRREQRPALRGDERPHRVPEDGLHLGHIATQSGDTWKSALNTPEAAKALAYYASFYKDGLDPKAAVVQIDRGRPLAVWPPELRAAKPVLPYPQWRERRPLE